MEKIISSLRETGFMHLLALWFAGTVALGAFSYYDTAAATQMFFSPWYGMIYAALVLCVTLPFVYERTMPLGGYMVLLTAHGLLMANVFDRNVLIIGAVAAGLFLDIAYERISSHPAVWTFKVRLFSAACAALLWLGYLASITMLGSSPWESTFWIFTALAAAVVGYLLSFMIAPQRPAAIQ